MLPLLRLELRRHRAAAVKMMGIAILVCLVFYAMGKRAPSDRLAVLVGTSLAAVFMVPMGISREKMEGTLDFVCGLPVEPRAIAASRFIAAAVIAVPWAVGIGFVSGLAPAIGALDGVAVAVLAWLGIMLLASCFMALFTIFDLESVLGWPFAAFIIALMVLPRLVRALFPGITQEAILRLLQQPTAPLVLSLVLLAMFAIVAAISFALTTRGFANYRPGTATMR